MDLKKMGHNLHVARTNMGLTQAQLAEKLNITLNTYTKIERGLTNVPVRRLFEISEILEINPAELLEENYEMSLEDVSAELLKIKHEIQTIKNSLAYKSKLTSTKDLIK